MTYSHLGALEGAGLVQRIQLEPEVEYLFRHALVQEVAYASLIKQDRQWLHHQVGAVLEQVYAGQLETQAAVLAHHFYQAGDAGRAWCYFMLAGDQATATFANQEAAHFYRLALSLATEPLPKAQALAHLGRVLHRHGAHSEAIAVWQDAIGLYCALGDYDQVGWLYARSARAAWFMGNRAESLKVCRQGLAVVADAPQAPGIAALQHEMARACYFQEQYEAARQFCQQALQTAQQLGALEVQADALATWGILPSSAPEDAVQALTLAVEIAEAAGWLTIASRAHNNLGTILMERAGRVRAASQHYWRSVEIARLMGTPSQELLALLNAFDLELFLGNLDMVERTLPALFSLINISVHPGPPAFGVCISQARLHEYRGQWETAVDILRVCVHAAYRQADWHHFNAAGRFLAETLLEMGQWEAAAELLPRVIAASGKVEWNAVWPGCLLAVTYVRQGQLAKAQLALQQAEQINGTAPAFFDRMRLDFVRGVLAAAQQEWETAIAAFERAAAQQIKLELQWHYACTLYEWAQVYRARNAPGDRAQAQNLLQLAETVFKEMGAARYVAAVYASLQTWPSACS